MDIIFDLWRIEKKNVKKITIKWKEWYLKFFFLPNLRQMGFEPTTPSSMIILNEKQFIRSATQCREIQTKKKLPQGRARTIEPMLDDRFIDKYFIHSTISQDGPGYSFWRKIIKYFWSWRFWLFFPQRFLNTCVE